MYDMQDGRMFGGWGGREESEAARSVELKLVRGFHVLVHYISYLHRVS